MPQLDVNESRSMYRYMNWIGSTWVGSDCNWIQLDVNESIECK